MKVVFLDFDGVLNSAVTRRAGTRLADRDLLELLRGLIDSTGAVIVLSTSWRLHWEPEPELCSSTGHEINALFAEFGMSIYGKTPRRFDGREEEIRVWLDAHPDTEAFVILDDAVFGWERLSPYLVLTADHRGLDPENVAAAIAILNKE